jgi:membrane-bound lytic murein transglycosylase D
VIALGVLYLETAFLLAVGALVFWGLQRFALRLCAAQPARVARFASAALIGAALLPVLWRAVDGRGAARVPVQIWAPVAGAGGPTVTVALASSAPRSLHLGGAPLEGMMLALAGAIAFGLGKLAWDAWRLQRYCRSLPVVRRIGRVIVCAADGCAAPFAARVRGRAYIVIPTELWSETARVRLVVAHEAHHHRRGDLFAAWMLGLLHALYFWNPAARAWQRLLAGFAELACDRFVIDHRAAPPSSYARCLIWAAEMAHAPRFRAIAPMAAAPAAFLKRRIEMLLTSKNEASRGRSRVALAGALALVVGASALAHAAVGDRRITRSRAEAAAARAPQDALPVEIDDAVLAALNDVVATPAGRAAIKRSLERMQAHRTMIAEVLAQRGLPAELAAVALMESGFDNQARPARPADVGGAGIWQLVPGAARAQGLRVDGTADERLDPRRETEAAASMLAGLHRQFGDWLVAIAAYGRGAAAIAKAAAGSRDGRALYRSGTLGRYPAQIIAGVLVLRDPSLLD